MPEDHGNMHLVVRKLSPITDNSLSGYSHNRDQSLQCIRGCQGRRNRWRNSDSSEEHLTNREALLRARSNIFNPLIPQLDKILKSSTAPDYNVDAEPERIALEFHEVCSSDHDLIEWARQLEGRLASK
jgi:hypothetical protein